MCHSSLAGAQGGQSNVLKLLLCLCVMPLEPCRLDLSLKQIKTLQVFSLHPFNSVGMEWFVHLWKWTYCHTISKSHDLFLVGFYGLAAGKWLVGFPIQSKFWWQACSGQTKSHNLDTKLWKARCHSRGWGLVQSWMQQKRIICSQHVAAFVCVNGSGRTGHTHAHIRVGCAVIDGWHRAVGKKGSTKVKFQHLQIQFPQYHWGHQI